jgi:hypothetical protein
MIGRFALACRKIQSHAQGRFRPHPAGDLVLEKRKTFPGR